jgi:hypothetical protein
MLERCRLDTEERQTTRDRNRDRPSIEAGYQERKTQMLLITCQAQLAKAGHIETQCRAYQANKKENRKQIVGTLNALS